MPIDYSTPAIAPPTAQDLAAGPAPVPEQQPTDQMAPQTTQMAPLTTPLGQQFEGFASTQLNQPGRYGTDLVQQGLALINDSAEKRRGDALSVLDERMSSRGLVGSDIESGSLTDLLDMLNQERSQSEFNLLREMATTNAADIAAAGQVAAQAIDAQLRNRALQLQEQGMGLDEAFRRAQLDLEQEKFLGNLGIAQQDIDLRAQQLQQEYELQGRSLDIEEANNLAQLDLAREQMLGTLNIQQQQVDLRAQELQQEAALQGRALDIEEANNLARIELEREALLANIGIQQQDLELRAQALQQQAELAGKQMDHETAMQQAELEARTQMLATQIQADAAARGETFTHEQAMQEARIAAERQMEADRMLLERDRMDLSEWTVQMQTATSIYDSIMRAASVNGTPPDQNDPFMQWLLQMFRQSQESGGTSGGTSWGGPSPYPYYPVDGGGGSFGGYV